MFSRLRKSAATTTASMSQCWRLAPLKSSELYCDGKVARSIDSLPTVSPMA